MPWWRKQSAFARVRGAAAAGAAKVEEEEEETDEDEPVVVLLDDDDGGDGANAVPRGSVEWTGHASGLLLLPFLPPLEESRIFDSGGDRNMRY